MPTEFRLPDLPEVGYATRRERAMSDGIMFALRAIERDRLQLLTIIIEGRAKWRTVAKKAWRAWRVDDEALDAMFQYLELLAVPPAAQRALLRVQGNETAWRTIMRLMLPDLERQREALRKLPRAHG